MIAVPSGARVWLALGRSDMRRGFDGLAGQVQATLAADPFSGHLFVFRGRRGDLVKLLWYDGQGLCLFAKRLETGRFVWPSAADGKLTVTSAQLAMLLEGIDWRAPRRTTRPEFAGRSRRFESTERFGGFPSLPNYDSLSACRLH